jgi:hypothetical protein
VSYIKKWNGSSWQTINPKRWNGSSWVNLDIYKWDGSKWVNLTSQQYTTTWNATWSQTYRSTNEKRTDTRGNTNMMQGDSGQDPWNINRSLCGFGDIQSTLAGSKINKVELYMKSKHWWYYAGGTAVIGYHNHSSEPSTFSHSKYGAKYQKFNYRGHAQWITMPNEFAEGIRDGRYKGFSLYASSTSKEYYGEIYGAYDSYEPKLKITYTK